jgi:hypothetical protein
MQDHSIISVGDNVWFESVDDVKRRIKANFRGWYGDDMACVVYDHGHQIIIERNRIFNTDNGVNKP